jgi:large subunit ribosomal protein L3
MATGILGKKIGMTQIFRDNGNIVPVTLIEAGPCSILQVKSKKTDGYSAIQLGFGDKKESRTNKPDIGRFKSAKSSPKRFVKEIRTAPDETWTKGDSVKVDFKVGEFLDVTGTSIGKGFQGGMKRWHWKGGPKTHGSTSHRRPGSIGSSSDPSRVFKGHHLPGHMGHEKKTVQNLEVIKIDPENSMLVVRGSVPGPKNGYVIIRKAKKR